MLVLFFWSAKRILPKREWEGEMGREAGRRAEGAKREGERGEETYLSSDDTDCVHLRI